VALQSEFQNFNPNITKYNPENALALAKAAQLAYAYNQGNTIQQTVASWGFNQYFQMWDVQGTQSYVAASEEAVLVVFTGTNQPRDWLDNIGVFPLQGPVGSVHRGFMIALERVWGEMKEVIYNKIGSKNKTLWVTGHSLGAALATLAVAKLRLEEDLPVNGLYTYGSPRVGDRIFARNFNLEFKPAFRIVNNNDIVTRVPARLMLYSHVGNFLYLDEQEKLHSDIHWWYQFLDSVQGVADDLIQNESSLDSITDHKMEKYIAGLEKNRTYNPYQ
jgi:triacylglycerol lipase